MDGSRPNGVIMLTHRAIISLAAAALLAAPQTALAHPGGLDARGGHYNRKTGEYHCHRASCETDVRGKDRREICNQGYGAKNCGLDERRR
jgi:hypothetical protein